MDGVGRKMQNGVARAGRRQTSWSQLDPPHPEPVPTGQALDSLCRMGGCSRGPPRARAHALGRVAPGDALCSGRRSHCPQASTPPTPPGALGSDSNESLSCFYEGSIPGGSGAVLLRVEVPLALPSIRAQS